MVRVPRAKIQSDRTGNRHARDETWSKTGAETVLMRKRLSAWRVDRIFGTFHCFGWFTLSTVFCHPLAINIFIPNRQGRGNLTMSSWCWSGLRELPVKEGVSASGAGASLKISCRVLASRPVQVSDFRRSSRITTRWYRSTFILSI